MHKQLTLIRHAFEAPSVREHPFVDGRHSMLNISDLLEGVNPLLVHTIAANSIDSFGQPHHFTSMAPVNLRQGNRGPLRSFMARFSDIFVKICNPNLKVSLHSMLMALKAGSFPDNLCKDPPTNMDNLRTRTTDYI
ncbi:hypothetical protein CR513_61368, partial [Mucuna pruriens]